MAANPRPGIRELAIEEVRTALGTLEGRRVLDVGAGAGRVAAQLADAGARVSALDFAAPDAPPEGVTFQAHDLSTGTLPFEPASFDAVVSTEVFEHLRAPFLALGSMVRVLRPGGVLALTMPNYWNIHYRARYLLTGHLQRPYADDARKRALYLEGRAPHINAVPFPVLRTLLEWEGCEDVRLRAASHFPWRRRLRYAPLLGAIRMAGWMAGREARRLWLDQTNGRDALLGRRHILVSARKRADAG